MAHAYEEKLVKYCCRINFSQDTDRAVERILNLDLDWDFIVSYAEEEDVTALLYFHLFRNKQRIPQESLSKLKDNFKKSKEANLTLYEELKNILGCFKQYNIRAVLLKGIDLAERIYPEIGLRPMSDIDILIRKQDLPDIEQALIPLNYLMHPKYRRILNLPQSPYLNTVVCKKLTAPFVSLHLHWHILNNSFYPGYGYISNLDISKIWQDVQESFISGIQILRMAPHHLLLHLAQHHFKHYYNCLIQLCDIDGLLNHYQDTLDWQKVLQQAYEFNFNRPLYYSLYFTKEILGTNIPAGILTELKPSYINRFERRFINSVLKGKATKNLSFFMFLSMNRGLGKKFIFLFRTILPHPKFRFQLQDIYGIDSGLKYNLNHISRIVKYLFRFLLRK